MLQLSDLATQSDSATQWLERSIGENRHVLFFCAVLRNWCRVVLIIMLCRHFRPTICMWHVQILWCFSVFFSSSFSRQWTFYDIFQFISLDSFFRGFPESAGSAKGRRLCTGCRILPTRAGHLVEILVSFRNFRIIWSKETCMRLNEYHMNHVYICVCIQHAGCVSRGFLSPVSSLRRMMISQLGSQNARFSWHFVRFFVHFIHPSVRVHSSPNQSEHFCSKPFLAHSISFIFSILLIFLFNCWWVDFCVLFGLIFPNLPVSAPFFGPVRMLTMTKALWKHPECCTRATMPTRHRR